MCRRVSCSKCGKATYAGCGAHVEQVLSGVPPEARCQCRTAASKVAEPGGESAKAPRKWWPFG